MLLCPEVNGSKHLPTNQNQRKRKLSMRSKSNLHRRRCIRLISCLKELINLSTHIGIQSSVVMYIPFTASNGMEPLIQTVGTSPLTAVVDQLKDNIMVQMEGHEQEKTSPKSEKEDSFSLPPLVFDGVIVPVHKMTQAQLRGFVPLMIKRSVKRARPGWGKEDMKPHWWPENVPWKNVRTDHRPEDMKKLMPWTDALRRIVIACYEYHGCSDLLDNATGHISENPSAMQKHSRLELVSQTRDCGSRKEVDCEAEETVVHLAQDATVLIDTLKITSEKVRTKSCFFLKLEVCVVLLSISSCGNI